MAKSAKLSFKKDEMNKELAAFFQGLLENGAVDAVLAPMAQAKQGVRLTLTTSAAHTAAGGSFCPDRGRKRCKNCFLADLAPLRPQDCHGPAPL